MTFIAPGKTLGIIGGGSETYLFELEAKRMGFRTMLLTTEEDDIATQAADNYLVGELENIENLSELGHRSDLLLYMDENFNSSLLAQLEHNSMLPKVRVCCPLYKTGTLNVRC
ncbi:hypothetical protein [Companilactobacillus nodensis]|uniref:hypothetical protein n=1 Tax=Companilactobacillus nodensis TaxID=460870 RepID=UPI00046806D8|nr:hypothetical protein [Companilactobacillus nodensis]